MLLLTTLRGGTAAVSALAIGLLLDANPAFAVHECIDPQGLRYIQAQPCPSGQATGGSAPRGSANDSPAADGDAPEGGLRPSERRYLQQRRRATSSAEGNAASYPGQPASRASGQPMSELQWMQQQAESRINAIPGLRESERRYLIELEMKRYRRSLAP